jgi:hypothetical protein
MRYFVKKKKKKKKNIHFINELLFYLIFLFNKLHILKFLFYFKVIYLFYIYILIENSFELGSAADSRHGK